MVTFSTPSRLLCGRLQHDKMIHDTVREHDVQLHGGQILLRERRRQVGLGAHAQRPPHGAALCGQEPTRLLDRPQEDRGDDLLLEPGLQRDSEV